MKKLICMVLFSMLAAPTFAQDRYIADKLFTYMHSGPSNQYRILGSIDAGEKVKLIEVNKESGYIAILLMSAAVQVGLKAVLSLVK